MRAGLRCGKDHALGELLIRARDAFGIPTHRIRDWRPNLVHGGAGGPELCVCAADDKCASGLGHVEEPIAEPLANTREHRLLCIHRPPQRTARAPAIAPFGAHRAVKHGCGS